ncbi:hypothetical protein BLNAU_22781 [Blattamonas nauphoetae]|uniref:Uncharacterized protein n=1 Tax=Blattamonas nauphoetae TaxID=2049346 RepID=A0ABQ9WS16_9EUKA|nr:hypothetical protein BLNAU_22781 [Blattamonas nauphoetae]
MEAIDATVSLYAHAVLPLSNPNLMRHQPASASVGDVWRCSKTPQEALLRFVRQEPQSALECLPKYQMSETLPNDEITSSEVGRRC